MKKFVLTVDERQAGERIDLLLVKEFSNFSRAYWSDNIKKGNVLVDGRPAKPSEKAVEGSTLSGKLPAAKNIKLISPPEKINIIYEDNDIIVINKPGNLVVHPSGKFDQPSVAGAFVDKVEDEDKMRPGIVHRLDKETSGVMILSKNTKAKHFLQKQFKDREVDKTYIALVWGHLSQPRARIELPLARSKKNPEKMMVSGLGKQATSEYKVLKEFDDYSLLEIKLFTGRTHQIRVHFSHLGNPVVGDKLYSNKKMPSGLSRQFLHSSSLGIKLLNGEYKLFNAEMPDDLKEFIMMV